MFFSIFNTLLGGTIATAQVAGGHFAAILRACSSSIALLWTPPNLPNCLANYLAIHLRPKEQSGWIRPERS